MIVALESLDNGTPFVPTRRTPGASAMGFAEIDDKAVVVSLYPNYPPVKEIVLDIAKP